MGGEHSPCLPQNTDTECILAQEVAAARGVKASLFYGPGALRADA